MQEGGGWEKEIERESAEAPSGTTLKLALKRDRGSLKDPRTELPVPVHPYGSASRRPEHLYGPVPEAFMKG